MDQATPLSEAERQALAKLPTYLTDAEADSQYGAGEREGASWQHAANELADQAEDTQREIEDSFEVPLHQNEEDLEMLDILIENGWGTQPPTEEELAAIALGWGAYLGDLILHHLGGSWVVRPDGEHSSIRFTRSQTQFFPVHALLRRFALGTTASLESTYQELLDRLVA